MRNLLITLTLLVPTVSCSDLTVAEQAQMDQWTADQTVLATNFNTVVDGIGDYSERAAELFERAMTDELTEAEALELAGILATGPEDIQGAVNEATALLGSWWDIESKKVDLRTEAGGGWWEEILYVGLPALLLGQGMPTSGPAAPFMEWLQPLLEKTGWRNRRRRAEVHKNDDKASDSRPTV